MVIDFHWCAEKGCEGLVSDGRNIRRGKIEGIRGQAAAGQVTKQNLHFLWENMGQGGNGIYCLGKTGVTKVVCPTIIHIRNYIIYNII